MKVKKNKNITSFSDYKDEYYGKIGTKKRNEYEAGYKVFEMGVLLKEARKKKGMTQAQLAEKIGSTKSYISKIENNVKEARLSTLQKIIELGLGGKLELTIKV